VCLAPVYYITSQVRKARTARPKRDAPTAMPAFAGVERPEEGGVDDGNDDGEEAEIGVVLMSCEVEVGVTGCVDAGERPVNGGATDDVPGPTGQLATSTIGICTPALWQNWLPHSKILAFSGSEQSGRAQQATEKMYDVELQMHLKSSRLQPDKDSAEAKQVWAYWGTSGVAEV
jgi:hypothetical protein